MISEEMCKFKFEDIINDINCDEIYFYRIIDSVDNKYKYKYIINIVIPNQIYEIKGLHNLIKYCDQIDTHIRKTFNLHKADSCIVKEYNTINKTGGKFLITSNYLWNSNIDKSYREHAMKEHFQLEKTQQLYNRVNFNIPISVDWKDNIKFDFIFESYLDTKADIENLYNNEFIKVMRKHSEQFLNVDTRCLAFGEVEYYKKGSI